eukprot:1984463-Rhodomonas_salina.1
MSYGIMRLSGSGPTVRRRAPGPTVRSAAVDSHGLAGRHEESSDPGEQPERDSGSLTVRPSCVCAGAPRSACSGCFASESWSSHQLEQPEPRCHGRRFNRNVQRAAFSTRAPEPALSRLHTACLGLIACATCRGSEGT